MAITHFLLCYPLFRLSLFAQPGFFSYRGEPPVVVPTPLYLVFRLLSPAELSGSLYSNHLLLSSRLSVSNLFVLSPLLRLFRPCPLWVVPPSFLCHSLPLLPSFPRGPSGTLRLFQTNTLTGLATSPWALFFNWFPSSHSPPSDSTTPLTSPPLALFFLFRYSIE